MSVHSACLLLSVAALAFLPSAGTEVLLSDPPHGDLLYFNKCLNCHPPGGTANGTETCLWCHDDNPIVPGYNAPVVATHSSAATGALHFEYTLDCTSCHNPHDQEQNIAFGTTYGMYVRALLDETMTVTDHTVSPPITFSKSILSAIEFTNPYQFIDGDPDYTEDICSTCHTLTNHHRNDGTAPGGQYHYDGTDCTVCHTHESGFAPLFQPPPPPHGTFSCSACHAVDAAGNLLDAYPGAPIPNAKCDTCHAPGTPGTLGGGSDTKVATHYSDKYLDPTTGALASLTCVECHNPMRDQFSFRGNPNLDFVRAVIRGTPVAFESTTGPYSFAYDLPDRPPDMATESYLCNTCHTQTNHHQGDGSAPGGQVHYDGLDCTACHAHDSGFTSVAGGPHPQALTDCSNCHLDPATGEPDLTGLHGNDCGLCHTTNFSPPTFTFLGPLGSWDGECSDCHNPFYFETGNLEVPTKGHRCVSCHGQQLSTADVEGFHEDHTREANCVVCHGFVPDTGVVIGSGNRENCQLCHGTSMNGTPIRELHEEMVPEGTSCQECHTDGRPPVGVTPGSPVGSAQHVCDVCHTGEDPSQFGEDSEDLHKEHADERLDCGACHMDANLQDDREPMPSIDDPRRQLVDRYGYNECALCHKSGKGGSPIKVHNKHVGKQWQWCYNCHEGDDGRPLGSVPPVTQPKQACSLCHGGKTYKDAFPFDIHRKHADVAKCYACHQAQPPLFDWPSSWMKN